MSVNDTSVAGDADADIGGAGESIHLERLHKEFGDVVAVDDLSLDIESGEFLVLLGPSGCGKTTTLRMIAGLESPTSGEIHIGDDTVTTTLPQERGLSMVFQSYALYPHKSVRENLSFPLGKMDVDDAEKTRRVETVAEMLEIADVLDKEPGQLSGGQRQRVALGRTVVREPRAFLMDEPLSNLDAKLRVQTRAELLELQRDLGTTTVYVTHDQEEAMSLADRIAVMNDGELQQVGTPEEIYRRPVNEFVAGFIGEPAMNFFAVETDGRNARLFPSAPVEIGADLPEATETIGIRPEHASLASRADAVDAPSDPITCDVEVIEPLGNAYELKLARSDRTFTARLRSLPDAVRAADSVDVVFDRDRLHAFDANGDALRHGGEYDG